MVELAKNDFYGNRYIHNWSYDLRSSLRDNQQIQKVAQEWL